MHSARSRFVALFTITLLSLAVAGCFEIEQSIELDEDMSGTADMAIGIDFEPMILIMATMQKQMEGKEGPPTEEELAKARAEFKEKNEEGEAEEDMPSIEEANEELPEGIELTDMNVVEKDTSVRMNFTFKFDHLKKMIGLTLPTKKADGPQTELDGVFDSPFENLELVDEGGDTFTIRTVAANPADAVEKQVSDQAGPPDEGMEKMMEDAFRDLRFAWKIKAPFEVVSHNATRVEGDTLIWVYDIERFREMEKAGTPDDIGIEVTYRK